MSASKSSALSTISSARERPTKRGSHSSAPPPGTSDADLGIAEQRALPAGEAHVAGQHKLVADAARATANLGDAHDRRGREAQYKVAPKAQHLRPFSCLGYVEISNEEVGVRRLEHDDLHRMGRLDFGH